MKNIKTAGLNDVSFSHHVEEVGIEAQPANGFSLITCKQLIIWQKFT
jgi:hypothetical protein